MFRSRLALKAAIVTMVAAVVPLLGITTASATPSATTSNAPSPPGSAYVPIAPLPTVPTAPSPDVSATSALQTGMSVLGDTYGTGGTDLFGSGAFGWTSAVAQSTVEAYEQTTGDRRFLSDIAATYSEYVSGDPSGYPDFEDNYIDDTGWWGIAWMQAYELTGNSDYLSLAETDATFMYDNGWDTDSSSCGGSGGVWWYIGGSTPTGRLAIPNEVFLELTAWLYNVTGNSTYLTWANDEWSWFDSTGMIGSDGLVFDGYNGNCNFTGANTWSYEQGVILAGLSQLYDATGNSALLTDAENIANAEINSSTLDPDGVLWEQCASGSTTCEGNPDSFKGIFVQNLEVLAATAGTTQYNAFLQDQANAISGTDINSGSQFGMFWDAALSSSCSTITPTSWTNDEANNYCNSATEASALDALIAADDQSPATLGEVEASQGSGYCLDNTGDSSTNGTIVQVWQCNDDNAQQWEFIPDSNGVSGDYMLENSTGMCLDDTNDSTTDGTKVQIWTCLGDASQEWTQTAVGSYIEYVNSNGLCLDDTGDSHTDGTQVQVWSCNGDLAQQWEGPN
jgi:hypothetical protein